MLFAPVAGRSRHRGLGERRLNVEAVAIVVLVMPEHRIARIDVRLEWPVEESGIRQRGCRVPYRTVLSRAISMSGIAYAARIAHCAGIAEGAVGGAAVGG